LAKYVALSTHGSVWLRDRRGAPPDLLASSSAFADVAGASFNGAAGLDGWLARLAGAGMERIWLDVYMTLARTIPHREEPLWYRDMAFADGVNRCASLMVCDNWEWQAALDRPTAGPAVDGRAWTLSFTEHKTLSKPESPPMSTAIDRLEGRLERACAFAREHEYAPWDEVFARALEVGAQDEPTGLRHPDLFPDHGFTSGSRRLAAMAQAAWVFGGPGSWNDLEFADPAAEAEYRWVTRDLFAAVMTAFWASVNSKLSRIRR